MPTVIRSGSAIAGMEVAGSNDGLLVFRTSAAGGGSVVDAISLAADGTPTLIKPLPIASGGMGIGTGQRVVQVVNATTSTAVANTTTTAADTGLTATITPTSASNKVLIFVSHNGCHKVTGNTGLDIRLRRDSTDILTLETILSYTNGTVENSVAASATYLDSPATTNAVTYKTRFLSSHNLATVRVQYNGATSTITLIEVTP